MLSNPLSILILLPICGVGHLLLVPNSNKLYLKKVAIFYSFFLFCLSLNLLSFFDCAYSRFQFVLETNWIPFSNLSFLLGIDGISIWFLILTTLLIPICLLVSWEVIENSLKQYLISFFILEFFLILVFSARDLLLFYICFESVLIPMFIIIGVWGSRERKIRASYMFFLYTLLGSVLMLLAVLYVYLQVGSTEYETLLTYNFSETEQKFLWLAFFSSFASKIPMLPVHIWLPEAHVEAPTTGSVVLAGILLKLGSYGLIRYSLPIFPEASMFFSPFIFTISILGVIYTSLTAIRQTDLKRIIAYTSVAHMNIVTIGIFSFNIVGVEGAILQSLSHGFVSSGLFMVIGIIYDRYHSRTVKYYGGLVHTMPLFIIIFLIFTMSNIALPCTSSFIGEFFILSGAFHINTTATFFGAIGMILGGAYSLWLFNRISYGNLKDQHIFSFQDLNFREYSTFIPLLIGIFSMGIYPSLYHEFIHGSVVNLIAITNN